MSAWIASALSWIKSRTRRAPELPLQELDSEVSVPDLPPPVLEPEVADALHKTWEILKAVQSSCPGIVIQLVKLNFCQFRLLPDPRNSSQLDSLLKELLACLPQLLPRLSLAEDEQAAAASVLEVWMGMRQVVVKINAVDSNFRVKAAGALLRLGTPEQPGKIQAVQPVLREHLVAAVTELLCATMNSACGTLNLVLEPDLPTEERSR